MSNNAWDIQSIDEGYYEYFANKIWPCLKIRYLKIQWFIIIVPRKTIMDDMEIIE
jgi:hypothetical protein